jgi:hypothetical protein
MSRDLPHGWSDEAEDRFVPRQDGDRINLGKARSHLIKCCDCGLVHLLRFRVTAAGLLSFRAFRQKER